MHTLNIFHENQAAVPCQLCVTRSCFVVVSRGSCTNIIMLAQQSKRTDQPCAVVHVLVNDNGFQS